MHSTQYKAMELIGTTEERNAPVAAAIGEESFDDKTLYVNIMKINEMKNEKLGWSVHMYVWFIKLSADIYTFIRLSV